MDNKIKELIKENKIKILGASKTKSKEEILNIYYEGITIFGENYVQELKEKYEENLPYELHFIGKLQTNKIKDIVPRVTLIHSVSRVKELKEIQKECQKINKTMNILIELHLTNEEVPHSVSCMVESIEEDKNIVNIMATIIVDRDNLKKIIIGKNGSMIKEIGKRARFDIENYLGKRVYLELFVKVISKWRDKDKILNEIGYKDFNDLIE